MNAPPVASSALCFGHVMHRRLRPVNRRFVYRVFFLRLRLSELSQIRCPLFSVDRPNLLSFRTSDHGARDGGDLVTWIRALLRGHGIVDADGEVVLQTFPRVLGYVFNPVSFWYCYRRDGALRAVLAEVNNTFGERHNYLLAHDDGRPIRAGDWLSAAKVFHVSPFLHVAGDYRFRFRMHERGASARVDYGDADGDVLLTAIAGRAEPMSAQVAARALLGYPLFTLAVIARIHLQAFKLWIKRVPFVPKPPPPTTGTTR